ncbi:unnamed protein product [Leuciscus chuanchicus]
MRLGKAAIVFTESRDTMSVGLLSQSYLEAIGAQELFAEPHAISTAGQTGTRIITRNLCTTTIGDTEFDFDTDKYDILIRATISERNNSGLAMKVKSQLISTSLAYIAQYNYRPSFLVSFQNRSTRVYGYNTKSKEHYGIMMCHKNRLIKPYVKVSCQCKKGVGVIGVIECNFLQPTHNKQDFDDTDKYRKIMHKEYWNEIRYKRKKEEPKYKPELYEVLDRYYDTLNLLKVETQLSFPKCPFHVIHFSKYLLLSSMFFTIENTRHPLLSPLSSKILAQSDTLATTAESGMMEGFESYQGPAAAEDTCERDASCGTGRGYSSAAEDIIELPLKNEKKGMLERVVEEKTSLSALCDQLKCQLSKLLGTEQERQGRERRQLQTEDTASKPEPSAGVFRSFSSS